VAAVAVVVLVAGAVAGMVAEFVFLTGRPSGPPESAVVTRNDLTMKVAGILGYDGSYAVTAPAGTSVAQVARAQQSVAQDQQVLAGDERAESDASAVQLAAQSAVHPATAQAAAKAGYDQAQDRVLSDQVRLSGDQAAVASLQAFEVGPGTVYTSLPAPGQVIREDQPLYSVSGQPVPLLYGRVPVYRAFYPGMPGGSDVLELNRALAGLHYGKRLAASGEYSPETTQAVRRWQHARGLPATGRIPLGGVMFEPGPVRVTSVAVSVGQPASGAGRTILTATGTTPVVTVTLAPGQENLLSPGDAVTVGLPDGTAVGGHVTKDAGTVASVGLDTALSQAAPDREPVTVTDGSQQAKHALTLPANALLTLPGGGYGVDVVTGDGTLRLARVTAGLRSDTLVQVSGPGIASGTTVAVPSSLGQAG
jgi:peptidoglycan hydrolase-like protein with peptidoglycan-binding domain